LITRLCRKCGEQHPVFYFVNAKQTHLVMICGREWTYAPYEEGLAIEVVYSKALRRVEKAHRQMDEECDGARDRDRRGDKKYRPGWDDAAFIMRSDPEREKKPRLNV
jgi:hypothetical protein